MRHIICVFNVCDTTIEVQHIDIIHGSREYILVTESIVQT